MADLSKMSEDEGKKQIGHLSFNIRRANLVKLNAYNLKYDQTLPSNLVFRHIKIYIHCMSVS